MCHCQPTASLEGFSIAQISDVHVPTIKSHYLQRIVDQVNLLKADMVAITGDLVDGPVSLGPHIARCWVCNRPMAPSL